jgi:hypothetical protein
VVQQVYSGSHVTEGGEESGHDWTTNAQGHRDPDGVASLVAPPAHELEILYRLAKIGNMRSLGQQADHLAALDARYRPFAEHLRFLADRFQSRAILDWITRCRSE